MPGLEKAKEEPLPLLEKFAGELDDLEERFLNSRINNKEDMPFLERDDVIKKHRGRDGEDAALERKQTKSRCFVEPSRDRKDFSHSTPGQDG